MKTLRATLPVFFCALLPLAAAQAEILPGASVESLLAAARDNSRELRVARLEAAAASERIVPAGALPDPVLRVELENITRNGNQSPSLSPSRVGDTKYTLLQPLPFWGKRDLKRDIASADAEQANGRASDAWNELASRLKGLYAQYWLNGKSRQLTRENIELTRRLAQIARVRYGSGLATQQEAIRAQVEQGTLDSEQVALDSDARQLRVAINSLLARPATAPLAEAQSLRPVPSRINAQALNERLLARNPQLAIEAARINGANKSRELAYRNRYPDFTVGVVPMQTQNRVDSWSLMLEMNLPLQQGSRRSQEREAERMAEAAGARKEALTYRLNGELEAALARLDAARDNATISRDRLLPQAELSFNAALAAYESGKLDFATLLDAQRQIRSARLNLLRAEAGQQAALAEIERLLGEDL